MNRLIKENKVNREKAVNNKANNIMKDKCNKHNSNKETYNNNNNKI